MTYELALSYLASLNESRIRPGLERIKEVLTSLGSPHSKYPHILVGGTNGKGSVVSFLGACLSAAGYRTGLFTSPHLHKFEERIAVNGRILSKEELAALVRAVKDLGIEITYFECAAAMALLHFARCNVDIAILEVGLGGAWDATNATDPVLSLITSVERDHQEWLGHDLVEIAFEKAGVMRSGKQVIIGPVGSDVKNTLLQQAEVVGATAFLYGRDFHADYDKTGGGFNYKGRMWSVEGIIPGLKGQFQIDNAACALAALECLLSAGFEITELNAVQGIESARWPGRLQKIEGSPPVIVDAAHNLAAVRALIVSLEKRKDMIWLISALTDKDLRAMAGEMARISNRFVLVPLNHPRGRGVLEMEKDMPKGADIRKVPSVRQGIAEARELAGKDGCVFVAGSVVLAGEVLRELGILNPESRIQNPGVRSLD